MTLEIWYDMAILNSIKQWRRKHISCAVEGQSWSSSGVNWKSKKPVHAMREFTKKNRNVLKLQSQNSGDGNEADAWSTRACRGMPDCAKKQCRKISLDNYDGPEQINGFERSCCWKSPCVDSRRSFGLQKLQYVRWNFTHFGLAESVKSCRVRIKKWGMGNSCCVAFSLNEGLICPSWVRKQRGYGLL